MPFSLSAGKKSTSIVSTKDSNRHYINVFNNLLYQERRRVVNREIDRIAVLNVNIARLGDNMNQANGLTTIGNQV